MNPLIKLIPIRNQSVIESNNNSFDGIIKTLKDIYRSSARHLRKLESNLYLKGRENEKAENLNTTYQGFQRAKFKNFKIKSIPNTSITSKLNKFKFKQKLNLNLKSVQGLETFHSLNLNSNLQPETFYQRAQHPSNLQNTKINDNNLSQIEEVTGLENLNLSSNSNQNLNLNVNKSNISEIHPRYDYFDKANKMQRDRKNIRNNRINLEENFVNFSSSKGKFIKNKNSANLGASGTSGTSPYISRMSQSFYKKLVFPLSNPEHYYQNSKCDYFLLYKKRRLEFENIKNIKSINNLKNFKKFKNFKNLNYIINRQNNNNNYNNKTSNTKNSKYISNVINSPNTENSVNLLNSKNFTNLTHSLTFNLNPNQNDKGNETQNVSKMKGEIMKFNTFNKFNKFNKLEFRRQASNELEFGRELQNEKDKNNISTKYTKEKKYTKDSQGRDRESINDIKLFNLISENNIFESQSYINNNLKEANPNFIIDQEHSNINQSELINNEVSNMSNISNFSNMSNIAEAKLNCSSEDRINRKKRIEIIEKIGEIAEVGEIGENGKIAENERKLLFLPFSKTKTEKEKNCNKPLSEKVKSKLHRANHIIPIPIIPIRKTDKFKPILNYNNKSIFKPTHETNSIVKTNCNNLIYSNNLYNLNYPKNLDNLNYPNKSNLTKSSEGFHVEIYTEEKEKEKEKERTKGLPIIQEARNNSPEEDIERNENIQNIRKIQKSKENYLGKTNNCISNQSQFRNSSRGQFSRSNSKPDLSSKHLNLNNLQVNLFQNFQYKNKNKNENSGVREVCEACEECEVYEENNQLAMIKPPVRNVSFSNSKSPKSPKSSKSPKERKKRNYLINISFKKRKNEMHNYSKNHNQNQKQNRNSSSQEYEISKKFINFNFNKIKPANCQNRTNGPNGLNPNQFFYQTMKDSLNSFMNSCDKLRNANDDSSKIRKKMEFESINQKYFNKTCSIIKNIEVRDYRTFQNHWNYKFRNEMEDLEDLYKLHNNIKVELSDSKRMAARIEKYQTMSSRLKKIHAILNKYN